ncbi:cyclic nucleotide-binding domain-containing protein [Sorangium sp. So ce291]|uniref:cyclic nucleotide-binding domain-containing protein n=1 Tax=Sorangium sp. So ce291 TaxID=3133294 RepID=UPI003F6404E4
MHHTLKQLPWLDEKDLTWLLATSSEERVTAETPIVVEGSEPDTIFVVLEGVFELRIQALGDQVLARLGPGELIGEMALLAGEPASATVVAYEGALMLRLARKDVEARLEADPRFAARLYKAFALLAARRLKQRVAELGGTSSSGSGARAVAADWDRLSEALSAFKQRLAGVESGALSTGREVDEATVRAVVVQFLELIGLLNELTGDGSRHPPAVRDELGRHAQTELLPYILLGHLFERMHAKPRGYAGDYLTIHQMYENRPLGVGRLGPIMDRCILEVPTIVAVRNRRGLLAREISWELQAHPDRSVQVTSLACGPAQELFDLYEELKDPSRLRSTGIDIDFQALAFVAERRDRAGLRKCMRLEQSNLVYLALGRETLTLPPQDLIYSIGLIDYFDDKLAVLVMNYAYQLLAPGGRLILGNFHPRNIGKALADHVLDWKLVHRTEADMDRLYSASAFGRPCTKVVFEELGINLFAECIKERTQSSTADAGEAHGVG